MAYISGLFSRIPNDSFDALITTASKTLARLCRHQLYKTGMQIKKGPKPGDGFGNFEEVP
tara:strand:+ start:156815 stop:156994 length:180 start_codon:yes stop_codon:yes gene_type:complete